MNHSASTAARTVAQVCLGAESVRQARAGGSRRELAKLTGIPTSVISDIEDASVLPSTQQLEALQRCLAGIDVQKYASAHRLGVIPWIESVEDALTLNASMSADELAAWIAASVEDCDASIVKWRLMRELSRMEGSGNFTKLASGSWSLVRGRSVAGNGARRWEQHRITDRFDPEHDALFHVESVPDSNEIVLNRSHPYYNSLRDLLRSTDSSDLDAEELRSRLEAAAVMMRGLLVSWAEHEDGEKSGARREAVREVRQGWGRVAKRVALSKETEGPTLYM